MRLLRALFIVAVICLTIAPAAPAQPACGPGSFATTLTTMKLLGDCVTTTTILIPEGMTLNGNFNTITAVDPPDGHFLGAVVRNAGGTAKVMNLTVDTSNLANVCDAGADRLRGILFDGAAGTITGNTVLHVNQGASGCQEGNAIEVRNFDTPGVKTVLVSNNRVYAWQKGGIIANGEVNATISKNIVGASATQANLAANGIQIGFGAIGRVDSNLVEGNTWLGYNPVTSDWAATAILLYEAAPLTKVMNNSINLIAGNADAGIYVQADLVTISGNRVYDFGPDVDGPDMDIGIGNYGNLNGGLDNTFLRNKVRCYQTSYVNVTGPSNVILPCTDPGSAAGLTALTVNPRQASPVER